MDIYELIACFLILCLVYCFYQLLRNQIVFRIRKNWIQTGDKRWDKYAYRFMFNPSKHNWYGFKYPKDSDYKV